MIPQDLTPSQRREWWEHLTSKANWRISELDNGYFQTEANSPSNPDLWVDITRRRTIEEAESAIDDSIAYFKKRLATKKVVKKFNK